jgi:2-oxoglutarate ferredoxin oxidoreductase subunit beta
VSGWVPPAGDAAWCPGCGDRVVVDAVRALLPELDVPVERVVFVCGTGCASRFCLLAGAYGVHSVHGGAPAVATGLALSRPDLSVWVVTTADDALLAGGNHLVHALLRDVDLTVLLLNRAGPGPGGRSPRPLSLAIGAGATFAARTITADRVHLTSVLREAASHPGTAFVEIYQRCVITPGGTVEALSTPGARSRWLSLEAGRPLRFGPDRQGGVVRHPDGAGLVALDDAPGGAAVIHDPRRPDPSYAFALSCLDDADGPTPFGILRSVKAAPGERLRRAPCGPGPGDDADLEELLAGGDFWIVAG